MSKDNLLGKSLWEAYSSKVHDRMNNPRYKGSLTQADADKLDCKLVYAKHGAESCGDMVELFWLVDEDGVIQDARFQSFGCGTAISASDAMAEMTIGKHVDEAAKVTNLDVEMFLRDDPDTPAVPGQKMHCSVMAYDVIKNAVAGYKGIDPSEMQDAGIVCECAQVRLSTILNAMKNNNLRTVEEITNFTKAGGYCRSCIQPGGHESRQYYLVDILAGKHDSSEETMEEKMEEVSFESLGVVKQLKVIEQVMDEHVRPMLAQDGGGVEIEDWHNWVLSIVYRGACHGCGAATVGTLGYIQDVMQHYIDQRITVQPVM
jgi:NifU-like protein